MAQVETFESWCVLEMMGHTRTAGRVTEEQRFGVTMGRIDVPGEDGSFTTVYFGGQSVFRLTPCSEEAARAVARSNKPEPVHQWEMPQPKLPAPEPVRQRARPEPDHYGDRDEDDSEEMGF